ncbi:DUF3531 family protein [Leptolyngbya sp. FACHB-261]|uniref:DUF3531 family protein n=1 Tax=Leptolyngbya sp. FACHB-261 TaxID=2692806 RepID=UPI0016857579|nr:DUF3531 family protein [Leptolyngbya sp. FACHB-261]MBD2101308.1 DUF3531 family protein [Leptolyngbya sp. FACHB-261]
MRVEFREIDQFDVWIWLQFAAVPSEREKLYVEQVLNAWFSLGQLGGFNASNLQSHEADPDVSNLLYDSDSLEGPLMALMHNMGDIEYEGVLARCWFDLGTSDSLAFDVLVNALAQFSREYVEIEEVQIGGQREDWPLPVNGNRPDSIYERG